MDGEEKGLVFLWGGSFVHDFWFLVILVLGWTLRTGNLFFPSMNLGLQHGKILYPILIHFKGQLCTTCTSAYSWYIQCKHDATQYLVMKIKTFIKMYNALGHQDAILCQVSPQEGHPLH